MLKKRLAVLISGAPRGNAYCIQTLKRLLRRYDVTFFVVIREEFIGTQEFATLQAQLPYDAQYFIVPAHETERALAWVGKGYLPSVVKMCHEVHLGIEWIIQHGTHEAILRVRPDVFFAPSQLCLPILDTKTIWIPSRMSFSGVNDMIALGLTDVMRHYGNIFLRLPALYQASRGIPEFIIANALQGSNLIHVAHLPLEFGLYRAEILDGLDKPTLDILAHSHFHFTQYKVGSEYDTPENRKALRETIHRETALHAKFPLFEPSSAASGFFPPEIDERDGSVFRFFGGHAALWRDLDTCSGIRFKVHYRAGDVDPVADLVMHLDGHPLTLSQVGVDEFERPIIEAIPDRPFRQKRTARTKIGFFCHKTVVPAHHIQGSTDTRSLSMALGVPYFF